MTVIMMKETSFMIGNLHCIMRETMKSMTDTIIEVPQGNKINIITITRNIHKTGSVITTIRRGTPSLNHTAPCHTNTDADD